MRTIVAFPIMVIGMAFALAGICFLSMAEVVEGHQPVPGAKV